MFLHKQKRGKNRSARRLPRKNPNPKRTRSKQGTKSRLIQIGKDFKHVHDLRKGKCFQQPKRKLQLSEYIRRI